MASLNNTLNSTIHGLYSQANGKKITLIGSHFKDPLFVAPIVVNAICAACFLVFTIYSWLRREKEVRKAFLVMMTLLVGMTLSAFASSHDSARPERTCTTSKMKFPLTFTPKIIHAELRRRHDS